MGGDTAHSVARHPCRQRVSSPDPSEDKGKESVFQINRLWNDGWEGVSETGCAVSSMHCALGVSAPSSLPFWKRAHAAALPNYQLHVDHSSPQMFWEICHLAFFLKKNKLKNFFRKQTKHYVQAGVLLVLFPTTMHVP